MPLNDVVLVLWSQLAEVAAPAPDANDQVPVLLRVRLCLLQRLHAQRVELQLLTAELREAAHQHRHLAERVSAPEDRVGELEGDRSTIAHLPVVELGERLQGADRASNPGTGRGRQTRAEKLAALIIAKQEKDGSWWDYPLYDYHQPYGTGYCLMALAWCDSVL